MVFNPFIELGLETLLSLFLNNNDDNDNNEVIKILYTCEVYFSNDGNVDIIFPL